VVGVTKAVSERFGKGGIADRMIWFNGFPFLDNKEEHTFGVPVSQVMTTEVTALPAVGLDMQQVETLLSSNKYQGFPIVEDRHSKTLLGYIGRTELRYAIDRANRENLINPHAKCYFTPSASLPTMTPSAAVPAISFDTMDATRGQMSVDFSRFIDATPITAHPRLPLETVMELFKKIGPRVILIEYRGKLTGLVTVKDCLKYQFKVEAQENPREDHAGIEEGEERIWEGIQRIANWISSTFDPRRLLGRRRQDIRLGSATGFRESEGVEEATPMESPRRRTRGGNVNGGLERDSDDLVLELESR
jgi:chloride channel 3/4/5